MRRNSNVLLFMVGSFRRLPMQPRFHQSLHQMAICILFAKRGDSARPSPYYFPEGEGRMLKARHGISCRIERLPRRCSRNSVATGLRRFEHIASSRAKALAVALHKEAEVALGTMGIGLDWGGFGFELMP